MRVTQELPRALLLVLSIGVLLPTASIAWFMLEAMGNERLAVQQKLSAAYAAQVENFAKQFERYWRDKINRIQPVTLSASERFSAIVNSHIASSAIILDNNSKPAYPNQPTAQNLTQTKKQWLAEKLEFQKQDYVASFEAYQAMLKSGDTQIKTQALLGMARSQGKLGNQKQAITLLNQLIENTNKQQLLDQQGRNIRINSAFLLIDTYGEYLSTHEKQRRIKWLTHQLNNYRKPSLTASQRLSLMSRLQPFTDLKHFPTYNAEKLAVKYVNAHPNIQAPSYLILSKKEKFYHVTANPKLILLMQQNFIDTLFRQFHKNIHLPQNTTLLLLPPNTQASEKHRAVFFELEGIWRYWQLALIFDDEAKLNQAAQQQITAYLWTGLLIILGILLLGIFTASYVLQQVRSNQLKNDLIATVSHELKTPLSSIRMLVDTLLLSKKTYDNTTRDYLQLIAKENARLSRLIDNFLTFSRMERHKQVFDFNLCHPQEIANYVINSAKEGLEAKGFTFSCDIEQPLPTVYADKYMLETALLNLIENAQKYSTENKHIEFTVKHFTGRVCFSIADQGIGIEKRFFKKIFQRFFRADNTLSSHSSGCGIGLNIVEHIAKSHQGEIAVESQLGTGSIFTLSIPEHSPPKT